MEHKNIKYGSLSDNYLNLHRCLELDEIRQTVQKMQELELSAIY